VVVLWLPTVDWMLDDLNDVFVVKSHVWGRGARTICVWLGQPVGSLAIGGQLTNRASDGAVTLSRFVSKLTEG
jgi:hypothetical protein